MLYFTYAMLLLHTFIGVVLIGVILLQRGRGGGLAGAFGGMGGQSAFGNRAGDVFTKITIVLATVWIVLGCICVLLTSNTPRLYKGGTTTDVKTAPAEGDKKVDGEGDKATGDKMPAETELPAPAKNLDTNPDGKDPIKPDVKDDTKAEATPEGEAAKKDSADEAKKPAEPEKKPEDGEAAKEATEKKPE